MLALSLQFAPPLLKMSDIISALIKEACLIEGAHPELLVRRPALLWLRRSHSQTGTAALLYDAGLSHVWINSGRILTHYTCSERSRKLKRLKSSETWRSWRRVTGEMWESTQLSDRLNNQISFKNPAWSSQTMRTVCKNIFALAVVFEVNKSPDKHLDVSLKRI